MSEGTAAATSGVPAAAYPLKVRNFRLFWIGATISLCGDQFYFVALPWLVLQLTGSGLALGTILMLAAIPRAVFMLLGGAVSDRFSARRVLITTAGLRTLLVAAIAALIYLQVCRLWHLYLLAFAFGLADAFTFPAAQALIPSLVGVSQLPAANALVGGSVQISTIAGPMPAGLAVKRWGSAAAFVIDAVSFLFIIAALLLIRDPAAAPQGQARKGMWHSIVEGLRPGGGSRAVQSVVDVHCFGRAGIRNDGGCGDECDGARNRLNAPRRASCRPKNRSDTRQAIPVYTLIRTMPMKIRKMPSH